LADYRKPLTDEKVERVERPFRRLLNTPPSHVARIRRLRCRNAKRARIEQSSSQSEISILIDQVWRGTGDARSWDLAVPKVRLSIGEPSTNCPAGRAFDVLGVINTERDAIEQRKSAAMRERSSPISDGSRRGVA
jgi:hypothetical protein